MSTTYRIKDWDKHFENHESRKVKGVRWVALPNKHDGKSYRRLTNLPDAPGVFAAWTLILQVASKMPVRGVLADEDGPLDSDDLSAMTGFPAEIFDQAFKALTQPKIGWLEEVSADIKAVESPAVSRDLPASPDAPGKSALEGNGTEGNGSTPIGDGAPPSGTSFWDVGETLLMKSGMSKRNAHSFIGGQITKCGGGKAGETIVAEAVAKASIKKPADPAGWIAKTCQELKKNRDGPPTVSGSDIEKMQRERSQKARAG